VIREPRGTGTGRPRLVFTTSPDGFTKTIDLGATFNGLPVIAYANVPNHCVNPNHHHHFQPLSVPGWTSAFLLDIHRLGDAIEGRLSHCFATLAQDGLAECDQPWKNPLKYSAMVEN